MTSERKEQVIVTGDEDFARKQRIVEHKVSTRQVLVSRISQLLWFFIITLDLLLLLRFAMKLIAANPGNGFVNFLYNITHIFVYPFQSIIASPAAENGAVMEVAVIFAIVIYSVATWALVTLFRILFSDTGGTRNVTTYQKQS